MKREQGAKFIFVTGGVLSGLGKGITAASIGAVLQAYGVKVSIQKCDVYLNVDAGTLNPGEHGECYVTKDGAETDLDLGHYERFLDLELTQSSSTMSGKILWKLINDERSGAFIGQTLQLVPHFTHAIEEVILQSAAEYGSEVHIVEIGGTIGDYESDAFIEAIRELSMRIGRDRCIFAHVVYVPFLGTSQEFKSKPAQNSVRDLRSMGVSPDLILVRSESPVTKGTLDKISLFGSLPLEAIVPLPNAQTVYEVPLTLQMHHIGAFLLERFDMDQKSTTPNLERWHKLVNVATVTREKTVTIGLVAKYLNNADSYFSVIEALKAGAWDEKVNIKLIWVDAELLTTENIEQQLGGFDGIVVPGGFGKRGCEGMILAAQYAMIHNLPYLGICLGMQIAVIGATRMAGLVAANSTELDPETPDNVIYIMPTQRDKELTGGTMRLGDYECYLEKGSLAARLYRKTKITERHRHRYEVNRAYESSFRSVGLRICGTSPDGTLVEMVEHVSHPFFIATQAHPEFRSRPDRTHPLFKGIVHAAAKYSTPTKHKQKNSLANSAKSFILK
jgi:CTP synthase